MTKICNAVTENKEIEKYGLNAVCTHLGMFDTAACDSCLPDLPSPVHAVICTIHLTADMRSFEISNEVLRQGSCLHVMLQKLQLALAAA